MQRLVLTESIKKDNQQISDVVMSPQDLPKHVGSLVHPVRSLWSVNLNADIEEGKYIRNIATNDKQSLTVHQVDIHGGVFSEVAS